MTAPGWQDQAACRGQDISLFFGADGERGPSAAAREKEAAAVCGGCPVIAECAEHALRWPEAWGTWGGMSAEERRVLRRKAQRRGRRVDEREPAA